MYTLHLPEINGSADYSNVAAYCDMSTGMKREKSEESFGLWHTDPGLTYKAIK